MKMRCSPLDVDPSAEVRIYILQGVFVTFWQMGNASRRVGIRMYIKRAHPRQAAVAAVTLASHAWCLAGLQQQRLQRCNLELGLVPLLRSPSFRRQVCRDIVHLAISTIGVPSSYDSRAYATCRYSFFVVVRCPRLQAGSGALL